MTEQVPETLVTNNHHCVLNAGGLLVIELDRLNEDMDMQDIAAIPEEADAEDLEDEA